MAHRQRRHHADLAVGDVVGLTVWCVPDGRAGRSLVDRTTQVMERAPVLFLDGAGD